MLESYDEGTIFQILSHFNFEPNTFLLDNINLQNNSLTSFFNDDNIYFNKHSNKQVHFVIKKETPPMILKNEISGILTKETNIFTKIKKILDKVDKGDYLENTIIVNVKKQIMGKDLVKSNTKSVGKAFTKSGFLGRKRINDESLRNHNKYSPDNVISRIKTILKKYIIVFVNNIIDCLYTEDMKDIIFSELKFPKNRQSDLIKDVDYKSTANRKKKRDNLLLLDYTLEDFLSFNVSGRYRKIIQNEEFSKFNKKIITDYLFRDKNNADVFKFVLKELKFEDFLGLFIHTKELNDFPSFNLLNYNDKIIIQNSLVTIETYLKELYEENDDAYFICFLLLIYNFRRYFSIKGDRKMKHDKIKKK